MTRRCLLSILASLAVGHLVLGAPEQLPAPPPKAQAGGIAPAPHHGSPFPAPVVVSEAAPAAETIPAEGYGWDGPDQRGCGAGRFWVRGEYLLWWLDGHNLPPLLTTSPAGTSQAQAGVLGAPGTSVLFGGSSVNDDAASGGRITTGFWFDQGQTIGVEGNFFGVAAGSTDFTANAASNPIVARPFFSVDRGVQDSLLVAFPGLVTGGASVSSTTYLLGGEVNLRKALCCGCCYRVDTFCGYRTLYLDDNLELNEIEINLDSARGFPAGTRFDLNDRFDSQNQFHGGQVGFDAQICRGCFYLELLGKVALGATRREVDISGVTRASQPGAAPQTFPAGFLTQRTNTGSFDDTKFAVVPEVGVNLGVQLGRSLRAFVGYTFIYWTDVARAGDQIDLGVNTTQVPPGNLVGSPRPAFQLRDSDFWAQGINFGMEFRY